MNLLPVMVPKSTNSPTTAQNNSSENSSQDSEFTGILSDSLEQQNQLQAPAESSQGSLPGNLSSATGGENLPLPGESLPPANPLDAALGTYHDEALLLVPDSSNTEQAQMAGQQGLIETPLPVSVELLPGISVQTLQSVIANAASLSDSSSLNPESIRTQLHSQARQAFTGVAVSTTTISPLNTQGGSQASTGENNLAAQAQALVMAELSSTAIDDKLDFSRLVDKGLSQLGKESLSTQPMSLIDLASKPGLSGLKTTGEALQMHQSMDKPGWSGELGSRLVWLTKGGVQSAQLKLTPAHLGTIEVKITIQNDQANVSFVSQTGAVRDAIESSLPRLREMMQEAGVKLDQADISNHSNAQQQSAHSEKAHQQQMGANGLAQEGDDELLNTSSTRSGETSVLAGIDFYA